MNGPGSACMAPPPQPRRHPTIVLIYYITWRYNVLLWIIGYCNVCGVCWVPFRWFFFVWTVVLLPVAGCRTFFLSFLTALFISPSRYWHYAHCCCCWFVESLLLRCRFRYVLVLGRSYLFFLILGRVVYFSQMLRCVLDSRCRVSLVWSTQD